MRSVLLILALVAVALPASASNLTKAPPVLKNIGGNVWEAVHDAGNTVSTTRTWAKGTEIGSAKATDVFTWVYRERSKIPITATSTVSAAAVGRVAAKMLPLIGTASLAYDVWTELRCKFEDGQIKCDPGLDAPAGPNTSGFWLTNGDTRTSASTASASCSAYGPLQSEGCQSMSYNPTTHACKATCTSGYTATYATQFKCPTGLKPYVSGEVWSCVNMDGSTPSGACPDGSSPSPFDGRCPSGNYVPKSEDEAGDHYGKNAPKVPGAADKAPGIVQEGVGAGVPVPSSPPEVSGPPSVSSPGPSVTTTSPNGTTTTTNTTNVVNLTYNGSQIIINESSTTTNPDGSTTTTTDDSFMDWLCGISGMPDCNVKVNESGTPEWRQPDNTKLDGIKAADAAKLEEVAQTIPTPDLGWFDAPPIAACRKIVFPHGIGEADPCGVVDSVRSVMAYLWALVASWMAFGWIRQAVNGG